MVVSQQFMVILILFILIVFLMSFIYNIGGWDPSWEKRKRIYLVKPFKGHIRDRTRASRAEKITNAMKAMPDRIAKYKQVGFFIHIFDHIFILNNQELQEKKPVKDLLHKFNWVTSLHSRR